MQIVTILLCAVFWYLGGQNNKSYIRDVFIPLILGVWFGYHYIWWLGIAVFITYSTVRIGYGNYDPINDPESCCLARITHDKEGWVIRTLYGLIVAGIGSLPIAIYTNRWNIYIVYTLGVAFSLGLTNRLKASVLVMDLISGAVISSIILL